MCICAENDIVIIAACPSFCMYAILYSNNVVSWELDFVDPTNGLLAQIHLSYLFSSTCGRGKLGSTPTQLTLEYNASRQIQYRQTAYGFCLNTAENDNHYEELYALIALKNVSNVEC